MKASVQARTGAAGPDTLLLAIADLVYSATDTK